MDKNQQVIHHNKKSDKRQNKVAHINGKYGILAAIITGTLGILGTVIGNTVGKSNAIHEVASQVNTDTSSVNVHIDTKDDLVNLLNELISRNTDMAEENGKLRYNNTELGKEINNLKSEKDILLEDNKSLKNQLNQYSSLTNENKTLKDQINSLEEENASLTNEIKEIKKSFNDNDPTPMPTHTGEKTSIFELTTFKGYSNWYSRSDKSDSYYTDTYGEKYANAHLGIHSSNNENEFSSNPTYLLDNKYSTCSGHIAWPKAEKNTKGSAWIDFYSGKTLVYSSPIITVDSRLTEFSFDISGIEKLTVVLNGNGSSAYIIYQDFDLIE